MQMLYALSATGNGDGQAQIKSLVESIYKMREDAQHLYGERTTMRAGVNFFYPMAAACVKMTVDMTFGMVTMIAMLGSLRMGG